MTGISFIPPFSLGGHKFKRTNIYSELFGFPGDSIMVSEDNLNPTDLAFINELEGNLEELTELENLSETSSQTWDLGSGHNGNGDNLIELPRIEGEVSELLADLSNDSVIMSITPIEDYTPEGSKGISDFTALLGNATKHRVVRIAFLGDSFIEGDIITADIREKLQSIYGGGGIGFVPFSTPLAQNRPTIKHTSGNWKSHNLLYKKSAPASLREQFFVSGVLSTTTGNVWSQYETTSFRKNLNKVNQIKVLYSNSGNTELEMVINDTISKVFFPEQNADNIQQLVIAGSGMGKVRLNIRNGSGFCGYGVVMENSRGVSVDNFSIRSNSGLALFGSSSTVNRAIDNMLHYDLIVLQYGLNVMQSDVTNYRNYGEQFRKLINYIKACFPNSAILVMGIGDRSTMRNGQFVTMPGVKAMIAEQRNAAQECGVAFWNTYSAMGGENSMSMFVRKGWAAKDYTHLSFSGGRKIAEEFIKALEYLALGNNKTVDNQDIYSPGYNSATRFETLDNLLDEMGTDPLVQIPDTLNVVRDTINYGQRPIVIPDSLLQQEPVTDSTNNIILPLQDDSENPEDGNDDSEKEIPLEETIPDSDE